ncbi:lipopolysaccharide biosynthesis protein [Pararcticibacter amylolyticus]|uniref:Uncharacterized protein n=1 Tax=Pararcticibacter amylolyticus TaxID=2173175 RepID=A0A2U2PL92_9SPHI|nr:oligosaccharide flippase family protein [Pararcticibacter amylolyticus]PWG82176.1 hypothetical protein DDR33_03950 [Pararcticibacter amylolyticus]
MRLLTDLANKINSTDWLKSGLFVTAGKGIVVVSNFLTFYLLVRICTEEQYGLWILYTSIYSIFEIAGNSFVNNAIIKYYNDYKDDQNGLFIFNALAFCLFLTLIISVLLTGSIYFIDNIYHSAILNHMLWYAPLLLLFSALINFGICIEQGNMKFKGQLISSLIRSGLFIIYLGAVIILNMKITLTDFIMIQLLSGALSIIVIFFLIKRYLALKPVLHKPVIRDIATYGLFTFGVEVVGQVSNNIGQLISGALLTPAAVGIINVANRVLQLIEIPLQSISMILLPKGVVTMKDEGMTGIRTLYEKVCSMLVAVMFPFLLLLFIFSDQVIYIIAGDKFMQASVLLKVIVVFSLIKPFGRNAGVILNAVGKTQINFLMVIIPTAINLILSYVLIKEFGVIGSPTANLIATVVGFIFNQIVLFKLAGVELKNIMHRTISLYQKGFKMVIHRGQH